MYRGWTERECTEGGQKENMQRVDRKRMYRGWTERECTEGGQKDNVEKVDRKRMYRGWTEMGYQIKHCNIDLMDEGT
jgi:hypothetical protein